MSGNHHHFDMLDGQGRRRHFVVSGQRPGYVGFSNGQDATLVGPAEDRVCMWFAAALLDREEVHGLWQEPVLAGKGQRVSAEEQVLETSYSGPHRSCQELVFG